MLFARTTLCSLLVCAALAPAAAQISVVFDDPGTSHAAYYADLQRLTVAAGSAWTAHFAPQQAGAELTVQLSFADIATSSGHSLASAWVGTGSSGQALYEQGAAFEWRTGTDANGAAPDVQINIGSSGYLQNELWFDPDPLRLAGAVPADRTDAFSVLLHEWGHVFGFNGWLDGSTGASPGNYGSTFDVLVAPEQGAAGSTLLFWGAQASSLYGGAVPLTFGNYGHLGNSGAQGGASLIPDLMNGEVFYRGTRYEISALDLAIMADIGLPMAVVGSVPEPESAALLMAGLWAVVWVVRRPSLAVKGPGLGRGLGQGLGRGLGQTQPR